MNSKIRWYDWLVYRLFYWRWNKILAARPDIREIMIAFLRVYDTIDDGEQVKYTFTITKP